MTYETYLGMTLLAGLVTSLAAFVLSIIIHLHVLSFNFGGSVGGGLLIAQIVFGLTIFVFLGYPLYRIRTSKSTLDTELPYLFGLAGTLALTGMPIERLFHKLSQVQTNPILKDLTSRFVRNMNLFGMDTESALVDVAEHSPSDAFSKAIRSVNVVFKKTGNFSDLFLFHAKKMLGVRRNKLKRSIQSLTMIGEIYIALLVVSPLVGVIMLAMLSLLVGDSSNLPLSPVDQINLVVFVGLPVLGTGFLVFLDSAVKGR